MRNLLIRANGGEKIGMGHLVRCRALAEAWQDAGGEVQFASAGESAEATAAMAAETGAEWVVLDGYRFDSSFVDTLKQSGLRVLFIDDCGGAKRYPADLILNSNLHASEALYTGRAPATGLLLGPRYALLRRRFRCTPPDPEQPPAARRVLVTMGGSDPENVTAKVIRALSLLEIADLQAVVVVGP